MWRCVALAAGLGWSAIANSAGYVPSEVLARPRPGADLALTLAAAEMGADPVQRVQGIGVWRIRLPESMSVPSAIRRLSAHRGVAFAEPNHVAQALFVPNDPRYPEQWGLPKVQAPAAWDWTFGSTSVAVAIVDTGIDLGHPDLIPNLVPGIGFVGNANGDDDHGHGTAVAGIASAATNNALGIAGLGFTCKLMPVKVLTSGGSGTYADIASGIVWAADHGANVINLSLGGGSPSQTLEVAVDYAWARGSVLVAAAGGSGSQSPSYPAYYENCIAVAASDQNDGRASFTTYGDWVEVAAPGVNILTTWDGAGYQTLSGTSFATALVSGEAALVASLLGSGQPSEVRTRVERTADPVGNWVRFGRINAARATADAAHQILAPTGVATTRGRHVSGTLDDLSMSDDRTYTVERRWPLLASDPSAQVELETFANDAPLRSLEIVCETQASGFPTRALIVRIELYDAQAGRWEVVDERESTLSDSVTALRFSGAERFRRPADGRLAARIGWFDRGVASAGWTASTDWVEWRAN